MLLGNRSLYDNLLSSLVSRYQLYTVMAVTLRPSYSVSSCWPSISRSPHSPSLNPPSLPTWSAFCFCAFIFVFVVTRCVSLRFSGWAWMRGWLQKLGHLASGCTTEESVAPRATNNCTELREVPGLVSPSPTVSQFCQLSQTSSFRVFWPWPWT